jgi:hypothetical protein
VGQRVYPSNSTNSNNSNSGKRNHIATIHSADSSEGSRVSISSDQALTDYEAYRRGDRFYVRIPASDVPRAEAVRGRGFADVSAQRNGTSTTLAFRLQPGSTAHVQQSGNRLDVVIAVPGSNTPGAASRPRNFQWSDTTGGVRSATANANNRVQPARGNNALDANANKRGNQAGNKNSAARDNSSGNANTKSKSGNSNSSAGSNKPGNTNASTGSNNARNANLSGGSNAGNLNSSKAATPSSTPAAAASPSATYSPTNSQTGSTSPTPGQPASTSGVNSASPSPAAGPTGPRLDFWTRAKERGHYWLLLAQLNPIPVAIAAAILLLSIVLLLMQRRRAKATRRVRTITKSKSRAAEVSAAQAAESAAPLAAAAVAATPSAVNQTEEITESTRLAQAPAAVASSDNGRKERVSRAAEEAHKVFAGEPYDESILGSDDRETRRMVGAELLSAMVGRNSERRDRARTAFLKHGYFDDATRDLRVASSDSERAAAARRLSFVQDPEATPHLVGALSDSSPDVRRAAVEALMDQRDPAAIAPLNALLQSENDRKVPRHLIEQAIEACATKPAGVSAPAAVPSAPPPPIDTDREVIEI